MILPLDAVTALARSRGLLPFRAVGDCLAPLAAAEGCSGLVGSAAVASLAAVPDPLVLAALPDLPARAALEGVAWIRNTYTGVLWVLVNDAPGSLARSDLRALGLVEEARWKDPDWWLYAYALASYKPAPDWLNSNYWAHPERFGQDL